MSVNTPSSRGPARFGAASRNDLVGIALGIAGISLVGGLVALRPERETTKRPTPRRPIPADTQQADPEPTSVAGIQ